MSISDVEVNRERQQKRNADRRSKEAEVRPDAVHRALLFLMKECAQNNPDTKTEVEFFMTELDQKLADPEKLYPAEDSPEPKPEEGAVQVSKRFRKP